MASKRILSVGLVCPDVVMALDHYPVEDTDQRCCDQYWSRGGNASNNSTVLSILGAQCEFFGTMAMTHEIGFLKEDFAKYGISIQNCVFHEGCSSPISICLVNQTNGSRTIVHSNKNLPELTYDDFKKLDLSKYKWIHFEGRTSAEEIALMLGHVDTYNRSLADQNDRIRTSVELEKTREVLKCLRDKADYVFISKEYAQFCGCGDKEEAVEKLRHLIRPGGTVICPWGEAGAVAMTSDGQKSTSPIFPPERVIDTLGAGDTFNAATIFALSSGRSIQDAITYGCRVAGAKCGMKGWGSLGRALDNID